MWCTDILCHFFTGDKFQSLLLAWICCLVRFQIPKNSPVLIPDFDIVDQTIALFPAESILGPNFENERRIPFLWKHFGRQPRPRRYKTLKNDFGPWLDCLSVDSIVWLICWYLYVVNPVRCRDIAVIDSKRQFELRNRIVFFDFTKNSNGNPIRINVKLSLEQFCVRKVVPYFDCLYHVYTRFEIPFWGLPDSPLE